MLGLPCAHRRVGQEARPGPADDGPEGDAEGAAGDEDVAGGEVLEVLRCHADKVLHVPCCTSPAARPLLHADW